MRVSCLSTHPLLKDLITFSFKTLTKARGSLQDYFFKKLRNYENVLSINPPSLKGFDYILFQNFTKSYWESTRFFINHTSF